jgi:hypothetical protein
VPQAATGSTFSSGSSQPFNAPALAPTGAANSGLSAQDEGALAHACCAGEFFRVGANDIPTFF